MTITVSIGDGSNEISPPAEASSPAPTPRAAESIPPTAAADKLAPQPTATSRPGLEPTWNRQWTETLRDHRAEPSAREEAVLALEHDLPQSDEVLQSFLDALDCDDEQLANVIIHSLYDGCSAQSIAMLRDYGMARKSPPKTKRRVVNLLGELCWRGKIELDDATFDQLVKFARKSRDHQLTAAAVGALELHLLSLVRIQTHPQRQALIRDILQQRRKARRPSQSGRSRGHAK
ncbi:MAG: hypothetical protein IAG10_01075 [Planctomycetaceae bacterium]|nr:hypothetical protein [Planctomycetaceae bacterium]